jgi:hypothetical protein
MSHAQVPWTLHIQSRISNFPKQNSASGGGNQEERRVVWVSTRRSIFWNRCFLCLNSELIHGGITPIEV